MKTDNYYEIMDSMEDVFEFVSYDADDLMETFNLDRSYRNRVAEVLDNIERLKGDIADLLNVERISNVYSMGAVSHSKPSFETDKGRIWKGPFIEEVGF